MKKKTRERINDVCVLVIVVAGILLAITTIQLQNEYDILTEQYNIKITENLQERCIIYNAYNDTNKERPIANGLYWYGTDYYCVWAKNRTLIEQEQTDRHEYAHYLVDNDYNHFCKTTEE
jgi:hypothetical protein